eukprot:2715287-Rhodomonas_salina.1
MQIDDEIMRVETIQRNTPTGHAITVARAAQSTALGNHSAAAIVHTCAIRLEDPDKAGITAGKILSIEDELVQALATIDDKLLVRRGVRGTTATVHAASAVVSDWTIDLNLASASAAEILTAGKYLLVGSEVVKVLSVSGDVATVLRSQYSTQPRHHAAGTVVEVLSPGFAYGDATPLMTKDPGLLLKEIGQSSPYRSSAAAQANTLTVTLVTNYPLSGDEGAQITISSIGAASPCGAICETAFPVSTSHPCYRDFSMTITDQSGVAANASTDLLGTTGKWTLSSGVGQLVLSFLEGATLARDTVIILSFDIHNPSGSSATECAAATIDVTATGDAIFNGVTIVPVGRSQIMDPDLLRSPQAGVPQGFAAPLRMLSCTSNDCISLLNIGQETHLPAIENTITVTLALGAFMRTDFIATCEAWGSPPAVTVSGLTGSETEDTGLYTGGVFTAYVATLNVPTLGSLGGNSVTDVYVPITGIKTAFITVGSYIKIGDEFMLVISYDGNTDEAAGDLLVQRGQKGTTITTHADKSKIEVVLPIENAERCTDWAWDNSGCNAWTSLALCPNGRWDKVSGTAVAFSLEALDAGTAFRYSFVLDNSLDPQDARS